MRAFLVGALLGGVILVVPGCKEPANYKTTVELLRVHPIGRDLKAAEKVPAEVKMTFDSERGVYRSEVTKLGACAIKVDSKDEANYEVIENCTEIKATGLTVGIRCSRQRDEALLAKCPWLRRN